MHLYWQLRDRQQDFVYAPAISPARCARRVFCTSGKRGDRRILRQLRNYRDFLFEPVTPHELTAEITAYLQKRSILSCLGQ